MSHASIVNRLLWMQDRYGLDETDRVLQKTPAGFDVSVWSSSAADHRRHAAGGQARRAQDLAYLAELIREQRVTTAHFVPSMLAAFVAEPGAARLRNCAD